MEIVPKRQKRKVSKETLTNYSQETFTRSLLLRAGSKRTYEWYQQEFRLPPYSNHSYA